MGTAERNARYKWKEGREDDLRSFVDGRVQDGCSVTAALKEYGQRNDMSWLTARWKYYQIRKRGIVGGRGPDERAASPRAKDHPESPFTRDEEDFLGYLAEFVTSTRETGQDIVPFIKGLSRMAALSREASRLREERDKRRALLREDADTLGEVCRFLETWLRMPQVDRVGSLKEFSDRLSAEVGRLAAIRERLAGS